MDILQEKILNNIVSGQDVNFINVNFDSKITKVSLVNPSGICVQNSDNYNPSKKILRNLNQENCEDYDIMKLDNKKIENLIKNNTGTQLGFQSKVSKTKNLPVPTNSSRSIFSESSLDYQISSGNSDNNENNDENDKENIRDSNVPKKFKILMTFEIRLKMPKDKNVKIDDTTCVQYKSISKRLKVDTCKTFYDRNVFEIICICNGLGLTTNIRDKALSSFSKLSQFNLKGVDLCEKIF